MSVESEILRIQHNVADAYAAVASKSGAVPLQPTSANLAAAVESIPQTLPPPDNNPIGTVISFMGVTAPDGYLTCDGGEYSISEYPALAAFFQTQFGVPNYFGGDGTATFAVPDMRNLFLRGYHGEAEERLSGEVGAKQEATIYPMVGHSGTAYPEGRVYWVTNIKGEAITVGPQNVDSKNTSETTYYGFSSGAYELTSSYGHDDNKDAYSYTSRPVNIAVLYCIKAAEGDRNDLEEYDTEDGWHVRKWSNGYCELSCIYEHNVTSWTQGGNIWYSNGFSLNTPLPLASSYSVSMTPVNQIAIWLMTGEQDGYYDLVSNAPRGNGIYKVSIYITGRWK